MTDTKYSLYLIILALLPTNLQRVCALVVYEPNSYLTDPPDHPDRESWEGVGRRYREHFLGAVPGDWTHPWEAQTRRERQQHYAPENPVPRPASPIKAAPTCKVQVVRSVSDWSHGVLTEHSIQNACKTTYRRRFTHAQCLTVFRSSTDHGSGALHLYRSVANMYLFSYSADKAYRESILVCFDDLRSTPYLTYQ
jgi:hypothetical protein